jgi:hypothetical protein
MVLLVLPDLPGRMVPKEIRGLQDLRASTELLER